MEFEQVKVQNEISEAPKKEAKKQINYELPKPDQTSYYSNTNNHNTLPPSEILSESLNVS